MKRDARDLLAGAALGFLLATATRALLSTLFYLSLATLRLNATALTTLVLLAPALALVAPRARWTGVAAGLATAALPLARFTPAYVPLAAVAVGLGALALAQLPRGALPGVVLGVALNGAALLPGVSHDPMLAAWAVLPALGLAALAGLARPPRDDPASGWAGAAWGALLAVELAFLASPYAAQRHAGAAPWAAAFAGVAGLAAGLVVGPRVPGRAALGAGVLGLAGLALASGPLSAVPLFLAQAALGAAAARLPRPHGVSLGAALTLGLGGLLFWGAPMGGAEWALAMPLLALAPLVPLWRAPAAPAAPRRVGAAVLLAALLAAPGLAPPPPAAQHAGDDLVVVSWNVHQGFGNRGALDPALYAGVLRRLDPDVLILQEVDTARLSSGGLDVAAYLADELGLRRATPPSGVAVLSRFPHVGEGTVQGWTAVATLDVGGTPLHVRGVHLARNSAERHAQVDEILDATNRTPGPWVVAGDTNSCPVGACFGGRPPDGVHDRLATAFQDAWTARHDSGDPAGHTHPAWSPRRRIDVMLVRGLEVVEAAPLRDDETVLGSDHLPMVASLRLPAPGDAQAADAGGALAAPRRATYFTGPPLRRN